jgi:predicted transcriptional regulator
MRQGYGATRCAALTRGTPHGRPFVQGSTFDPAPVANSVLPVHWIVSDSLHLDLDARRANDPGEGLTPPLKPGGSGGTGSVLARIAIFGESSRMSAAEIIEQIKALPPNERAEVAKFFVEDDDSWVPESFKRGMADAEAGRFVDMETVLSGAKPPPRRTE